MYIGRQVNNTFLLFFMKVEFSRQTFEKYSDMKFHENPFSGSQNVPCGRTDVKLIVAFRNFANAFKPNCNIFYCIIHEGLGINTKGPKTCALLNAVGAQIL
jgi:hypothetical protein